MRRGRLLIAGGLCSSLVNFRGDLIQAAQADGWDVFASAGPSDVSTLEQLRQWGVPYLEAPLDRTGVSPRADLGLYRTYRSMLREHRIDHLLGYTIKPVIYGGLAASRERVAFTGLITGLGYAFGGESVRQRLVGGIAHRLYRRALRHAQTVFFQNPDDQAAFVKGRLVAETQARLVDGSGVNLDRFPAQPFPEGPITFLLIARLLADKGIGEFAEAARRLRTEGRAFRAIVLGPRDTNAAAISGERLDAWVREGVLELPGETKDVRPYLAAAHVVVLPSYYREGLPRTLLEGLASGRALITTDWPGCREAVEAGKNGFLVPIRDAAALAEAMARFLDEPSLVERMGRASRAIAQDRFDVHTVNETILRRLRGEA